MVERGRFWRRVLVAVFLVPTGLAVGLLFGPFSGPLLESRTRATAQVQINLVVGTRASFELASYVSDFVVAYTSPQAAQRAARASGGAPDVAALASRRTNHNAGAVVTFSANNEERSKAGLKAAAQEALRQLAQSDLARAQIQYHAAREALIRLGEEFTTEGTELSKAPPGDVLAARRAAFSQAANRMELRVSQVVTAQKSLAHTDRAIDPLPVTTETLSTLTTRARVIAAAAGGSILLVLARALVSIRRMRIPPHEAVSIIPSRGSR